MRPAMSLFAEDVCRSQQNREKGQADRNDHLFLSVGGGREIQHTHKGTKQLAVSATPDLS